MKIQEVRDSGLLELYAMGACDASERDEVEKALADFPELKADLDDISKALHGYSSIHQIKPSDELKDKLMKQAKDGGISQSTAYGNIPSQKIKNGMPYWVGWVSGIAAAILGFLYIHTLNEVRQLESEYQQDRITCDSLSQTADAQFALIEQLQDPSNEILPMQSTGTFEDVEIYFIYNEDRQQNFVQVQNIPSINDQQSFQLWSLKPDQNPIPMTVFQGTEGNFIPVDFEDGTATYAITIEPLGGSQSPTLENLLVTVNVT